DRPVPGKAPLAKQAIATPAAKTTRNPHTPERSAPPIQPGRTKNAPGEDAGGVVWRISTRSVANQVIPAYCYLPVAAWYLATRSAGTRPRSFMSYPCSRAQFLISVVFSAEPVPRPALPAPRPARRRLLPTLRAWLTYFPRAERSSSECLAF